ncbi:MAG: YqeG family HAD IIIA-type phosphatase [Lachnospiraceae bacterium]|nr:YqeG family HAD IIIA-type phosphatase [Lachnospiraceae bacterium]
MDWFPDVAVKGAADVPYEALHDAGYRVALFDIDNTIVPHDAPADEGAKALFARIKESGLKAVLISNNRRERVKSFADAVGADFVYKAAKPKAFGFLKGMEQAGGNKDNTFFVGDQIFTDVWGAKRAGLKTILTTPIDPRERLQIVLKRYLEKPVIALYKRQVKKHGIAGNAFAETVLYAKRPGREENPK